MYAFYMFSSETLNLNFASSHGQITQYLSNPQYYFQVNSQYVRNKLKVILFPFLHRVRFVHPFVSILYADCETSYKSFTNLLPSGALDKDN